ncbi:KH domain-containing protein At4g18375-like [Chenopodium quinoa]|uniref:KH domain-containing protein At4g18375-like n=1 Tax=Chenopodium quinoa TaxID=63459 RepID=UPI000B793724|nr:KH domain-containing protein At4g18375-like [Chenopodium quinoa]
MGETGKRYRGQRENYGDSKNQRRRTDKEEKGGDELIAYRILCPDTVIGSVIGRAGKVINSIRQETRAKVKVVDPFPGAKERVITIYCYVKEKLDIEFDEEYTNNAPLCPAQDALLRMHAAIANALSSLGDFERRQKDIEECNILVPASQSANVIGKSGTTIKKLRSNTRANIRVTRKNDTDPSHSCAMDFDNFVQISGDSEAVKSALFAVSAIMYKFAPKEEISLETSVPEVAPSIIIPADMPVYPASGFYTDPIAPSRSASLMDAHAPELSVPGYADSGGMWSVVVPGYNGASRSEELTIRVLCPSDKIGRVIGRGGCTIKSVRQASGTHIEVDDTKATRDKCSECLITVTSTESSDDLQSKAIEAILLLQEKINEDAENVTMSLLIPSRNIGCIIGKSGSIINEIRKRTRADIRISKVDNPKCADEGDEYVEVSGEVKNVRDALIQIILRLRDDALKDKAGASNPSVAPDSLYPGSSGFSLPPVLQTVPPVNPLGYEPRTESGGGVGNIGMYSSSSHYKYGSLSMGDDGYGSSYSSKLYGGLLQSSTLEIMIPASAVSKVIGKSGANLSNIRQISGAVIEISDPKSSRGDRVAHISGTPEQKRSAENLIQAFIMAT